MTAVKIRLPFFVAGRRYIDKITARVMTYFTFTAAKPIHACHYFRSVFSADRADTAFIYISFAAMISSQRFDNIVVIPFQQIPQITSCPIRRRCNTTNINTVLLRRTRHKLHRTARPNW